MDTRYFSEKVVEWYHANKRDLPWRNTVDPYRIWLSEIILQQTRVNQGLPYYNRFVERFRDVVALAAAPEEEILRLWQGLGYYSRARNLHKCAKTIVASFHGEFPSRYADLIQLPGIGSYTAAAIASFAAREPVAVVDGNVFRVLARTHGIDDPINSPKGRKIFSELAESLVPTDRPDLHNQAMMEFGALLCTPRQPRCDDCVLKTSCIAADRGMQSQLPVKIPTAKSRKRYFNYFVVARKNQFLMRQRRDKDIWQGLYDFYLVETKRLTKSERIIGSDPFLQKVAGEVRQTSADYKHVLSHQTIISRFILMDGKPETMVEEDSMKYYSIDRINELPKPVLITRFLEDYKFL